MRNSATEFAPAKVNLYLHILGKRDDGYHDLQSLVAFADVGDAVCIGRSRDWSLTIGGPFGNGVSGEDPENNLAVRAAKRLLTGTNFRLRIRLTKNLPVAAGIGGGSADAAAVVRAVESLLRIKADDPASWANMGADIPVSLRNAPSLVEGIGERLTPVQSLPSLPAVLVNPRVAASTGAVFRALKGRYGQPIANPIPPADAGASPIAFAAWLRHSRNDLTDAAAATVPAVRDVLSAISAAPGVQLARMSGSGATCFGLFPTRKAAAEAAGWLAAREPGWWVQPTILTGTDAESHVAARRK